MTSGGSSTVFSSASPPSFATITSQTCSIPRNTSSSTSGLSSTSSNLTVVFPPAPVIVCGPAEQTSAIALHDEHPPPCRPPPQPAHCPLSPSLSPALRP